MLFIQVVPADDLAMAMFLGQICKIFELEDKDNLKRNSKCWVCVRAFSAR